jgi:hypothetical protein
MARLNGTTITDACKDGANYFNSFSSPQEFYQNCNRGDWLLWLFARTNPNSLKELTLAKAHCANTVRHLMKEESSRAAVDTAIRFGEGKASKEELDDAYAAAYAAYAAADAYADAYAAYAAGAADAAGAAADAAEAAAADAAYAADAADAADAAYAADAADADADAADADAYAYAEAAAEAARTQSRQLTAGIVRKYLPLEIWDFDSIKA